MKSLLFGFQEFGIQVVTVQVEKREPCGQKNLRGAKKHFKNNKSISLHKTRKRPVCKCLQDCGGGMLKAPPVNPPAYINQYYNIDPTEGS